MKPLALTLLLALACSACGVLLTGRTDPAAIEKIMESTKARGCIYAHASAKPYAEASTILVGTWGDPPPDLTACWTSIPPGLP